MKDTNDVDWGKNTGTYASSNAISLKANNSGSTDDLNRIYDAVRRYYVGNGLDVSLLPAASDWVLLKHNYRPQRMSRSRAARSSSLLAGRRNKLTRDE